MSARTERTRDRLSRRLRDDLGEPFHIHLRAVAGGTICAAGIWLLLYALGVAVGMTPFAGLVASAAGGALGVIGHELLRGRVAGTGDHHAATAAASQERDVAIDEVWRELSQLRRELRQAVGHGASKVAR